jgi:hypothetical protein
LYPRFVFIFVTVRTPVFPSEFCIPSFKILIANIETLYIFEITGLHIYGIKQTIEAIPNGQSKMDNPEKPVIWSTQDEDKQKKITTQYVLDNTICKQTHIMQIRQIGWLLLVCFCASLVYILSSAIVFL